MQLRTYALITSIAGALAIGGIARAQEATVIYGEQDNLLGSCEAILRNTGG